MQVNNAKVLAKFRALEQKARRDNGKTVVVGYTQQYAIYVHENREARHTVGRAGFLLDVLREIGGKVRATVAATYKRTGDIVKSLLTGGLLLQRESQRNCPVDTGALRGSAFTRVE